MTDTTSRVFDRRLQNAGHTRRFVIRQSGPLGWEVREEEDSHIIRSVRYTDWHRVERARSVFSLRATLLREDGWVDS